MARSRFVASLGMHRRLHTSDACVSGVIGKRSFILTSVLLPVSAMAKPGAVPFNQGELRGLRTCPNVLRRPFHGRHFSFAKPLQSNTGLPECMRLSVGKPALHSFPDLELKHVLGTVRFCDAPFFG